MEPIKFTHLHTHSHYSLLDGLTKVNEMVARAKETGMDSIALTDHGVLYGAVEFYKLARKHGIKPILGVDVWEHSYYIDYRTRRPDYLKAFVDHLVNWEYVAELYHAAAG